MIPVVLVSWGRWVLVEGRQGAAFLPQSWLHHSIFHIEDDGDVAQHLGLGGFYFVVRFLFAHEYKYLEGSYVMYNGGIAADDSLHFI